MLVNDFRCLLTIQLSLKLSDTECDNNKMRQTIPNFTNSIEMKKWRRPPQVDFLMTVFKPLPPVLKTFKENVVTFKISTSQNL